MPWVKRIISIIVVLGILGGGGYYVRYRLKAAKQSGTAPLYATAKAFTGTMVVDVTGYGPLQPARSQAIQAEAGGTVSQVLVQPGDAVTQGQVVATITNTGLADKIQQDQTKIRQDTESLDAALGLPSNTPPPTSFPNSGIVVTAPISGRLDAFAQGVAVDSSVTAGEPLFTIVDDGEVIMDVDLLAADAAQVQVGDPVSAIFPQFAGSVSGSVTSVSPNAIPQGTTFVYPATITLSNTFNGKPGLLAPKMEAQVQITTANGLVTLPGTPGITSYGQSKSPTSPIAATVLKLDASVDGIVTKGQPIITLGGQAAISAIAQDEAQLQTDEATLQADQNSEQNLQVKAPMSGIIQFFNASAGQVINNPGFYMGSMFDPGNMELHIQVSELQVANVHTGQNVAITVPGLVGKTFTGTVSSVSSFGNYNAGLSTFGVTISVSGSTELKPGMTADADIQVAQVPNALMVPIEAVLQNGTQAEVEVLGPKGANVVPVTVGRVNDTYAQITSGLQDGDVVITGAASLPSGTATYTGTTGSTSKASSGTTSSAGGTAGGGSPTLVTKGLPASTKGAAG